MEAFDAGRAINPHLAFGYGVHRCVGAELAKIELRIAYPALVQRFPTLRLTQPIEELEFRPFSLVYGTDQLQVAW